MLILEGAGERLFDHPGTDQPTVSVRDIEGQLPSFNSGTWYLNGPGRFALGGRPYRHWLDGDGLIRALTFADGSVRFASRFVRTRKYCAEQRAGRPLYRAFGSAFAGDRLNDRQTGLETPANVSVLMHAGALLALGEQGEPWQIDPSTLETIGPFAAGGAITSVTPFAAHAKVDASTGDLFNFGVSFSAARPLLNVFRFDAGGQQVFRSRIPLHCSCTLHDFALGPTLAAFYVSPYLLDMAELRGGRAVIDSLVWRPELGSRVLLVSRETGEQVASIPVGDRYCLHTVNCHEQDGLVVLDVVEMPQPIYETYTVPRLFERPIDSAPLRLRLDPATARIVERQEIRCDCAPEFPALDPADAMRGYTRFWALGMSAAGRTGTKFFDQLVAFRWDDPARRDTYQASSGVFLGGEPLVIRDRDGVSWLIVQLFDTNGSRGGFAVFAADDVARGPVARLWLDTPTPMAFHGTFIAA